MSELYDEALKAQEQAYAPYSAFRVGAAIRTVDGAIYSGCNVENAAYPEGICAEGSAIAAMVRAGEREIAEVVVVGSGPVPCAPCGGCRQKLGEFSSSDTKVKMYDRDGNSLTATMSELLPHAFGPRDLEP